MDSTKKSTELTHLVTQLQDPHIATSSNPLLSESPFTNTISARLKLLMIWPLAVHFIGSLAVTTAIYFLNGRQFYLERQPRVQRADGTFESPQLGQYNLLQPEVTTILPVSLVLLRWVAAAWAVPLCWRAVFVVGGNYGLRYRDISWATSYGIFYPSTHIQRPMNALLGVILILTLAPQPSAPLFTGSISGLPSNKTIDLPDRPTITIAGFPQNPDGIKVMTYSGAAMANIATTFVKYFNTAWSQASEEFTFKRVVPSIAHLSVGSTVDSVLLPYFTFTKVDHLL